MNVYGAILLILIFIFIVIKYTKILPISFSNKLTLNKNVNSTDNKINVFCQFFIPPNKDRYNEILETLKFNVNNKYIDKIYLLNEKIYSYNELGITSNKIIQVNIGKRLKFKYFFEFINKNNIKGYNILINSDIFFDHTIEKLKYSDLDKKKQICALLRYDYNPNDKSSELIYYGLNAHSQDTWIIHSNNKLTQKQIEYLDFEMGKPYCDTVFLYYINSFGYEIINDPKSIRTFHYHTSNIRNYSDKDNINGNTYFVIPYMFT
jgi:hypothetical protein